MTQKPKDITEAFKFRAEAGRPITADEIMEKVRAKQATQEQRQAGGQATQGQPTQGGQSGSGQSAHGSNGQTPPRQPPPGAAGAAQGAQSSGDYTKAELDELTKKDLEYYRRGTPALPQSMADEAFYGVAGKIVKLIEVQSEASREGILAQLLVGLGNIVGRGPRIKQSAWHFLNEFVVLVGKTSFGRKGTST